MNIYLMARYSRHPEMQEIAQKLQILGHTITAHWISGEYASHDRAVATGTLGALEQQLAEQDIADIQAADLCIGFSEARGTYSRGGRHCELGMALAWMKRIIIVGGSEHIFHALSAIEHVADLAALLALVGAIEERPAGADTPGRAHPHQPKEG